MKTKILFSLFAMLISLSSVYSQSRYSSSRSKDEEPKEITVKVNTYIRSKEISSNFNYVIQGARWNTTFNVGDDIVLVPSSSTTPDVEGYLTMKVDGVYTGRSVSRYQGYNICFDPRMYSGDMKIPIKVVDPGNNLKEITITIEVFSGQARSSRVSIKNIY